MHGGIKLRIASVKGWISAGNGLKLCHPLIVETEQVVIGVLSINLDFQKVEVIIFIIELISI